MIEVRKRSVTELVNKRIASISIGSSQGSTCLIYCWNITGSYGTLEMNVVYDEHSELLVVNVLKALVREK